MTGSKDVNAKLSVCYSTLPWGHIKLKNTRRSAAETVQNKYLINFTAYGERISALPLNAYNLWRPYSRPKWKWLILLTYQSWQFPSCLLLCLPLRPRLEIKYKVITWKIKYIKRHTQPNTGHGPHQREGKIRKTVCSAFDTKQMSNQPKATIRLILDQKDYIYHETRITDYIFNTTWFF